MKKTILFILLCAFGLSVAAQSKKELQEKITVLETENAVLTARIGEKDAQIGLLTGQVASLQQQLAALQAQAARSVPKFLSDSIADFLMQFYRASTVEERAKFVMDPARVLPKMRDYYKNGINTLDKFYRYAGEETKEKEAYEGAVFIAPSLYGLRVDLVKGYLLPHYVYRTPEGFKLDWEATMLYGQTTVKQIKNKARDNNDKIFTFSCGLVDLSIRRWHGNDDYEFVRGCQCADGDFEFIDIVFEKESAVGSQLRNLIENKNVDDGSRNQFILKGVYYYNDGNEFIELQEIVSETPSMLIRTRPNKSQSRF